MATHDVDTVLLVPTHQGSELFSLHSRGLQSMPNSLYALLYHYRKTMTAWTSTDVDIVLYNGDVLYQQMGKKGLLFPSHLPRDVMIFNSTFKVIENYHTLVSFYILI